MPQGILPEASDFEIHNSQFIDNSHHDNSQITSVSPRDIFQTSNTHSSTINNTQNVNDSGLNDECYLFAYPFRLLNCR